MDLEPISSMTDEVNTEFKLLNPEYGPQDDMDSELYGNKDGESTLSDAKSDSQEQHMDLIRVWKMKRGKINLNVCCFLSPKKGACLTHFDRKP